MNWRTTSPRRQQTTGTSGVLQQVSEEFSEEGAKREQCNTVAEGMG
jgi:hypothetical protein